MKFGGLSRQLVGGIVLVVLGAFGATYWLFAAEMERLRDAELTGQLLTEARMLSLALQDTWAAHDTRPIAGLVHAVHNEGTDVVVLSAQGTVLLSTLEGHEFTATLPQRAVIKAALLNGSATDIGHGIHGPAPSREVAVRTGSDADEQGCVWLARPRWTFVLQARHIGLTFTAIAAVALAAILALSLTRTRRWADLLRRLTHTAQRFSAGDLSVRAAASGSDEFALLAGALNEIRKRLRANAETDGRQRQTLEALLAALHEGVVVTDGDGRIVVINPAALRLLHLETTDGQGHEWAGRAVEECIPQHELQRLLRVAPPAVVTAEPGATPPPQCSQSSAANPQPVEERSLRVATGVGTVHLLARAADLRLPSPADQLGQASWGRLAVLTDVTALHQALQVQTDFVANASHELRTPLASIRAAIETLASLDWQKDGAAAERFIEMIDRHSARLTALATDLLDLSRVQAAAGPLQATSLALRDVLRELTERFADAAGAKGVKWQVEWNPNGRTTIIANGNLLRLVLDNLADNAIQFSEPGGHVTIACRRETENVVFEVADEGCGIPEADQHRVFERFYQVERARSGSKRGSGLGLAIVRDAVSAMGGAVRLQSQVGRGTRVTVILPQVR